MPAAGQQAAPTPLRILVCPHEFKGALAPPETASAIAAGLRAAGAEAGRDILITTQPMADGGPGTLDLLAAAHASGRGSERVMLRCTGPLGQPLDAAYLLLPAGADGIVTAVVEAAATVGIALAPPAERDPGRATTRGVGEQIADALRRGARRVMVGVGGAISNDGGAGALQALGYRLLDAAGQELPPGGLALERLDRAEPGDAPSLLRPASLLVATDVTNPLLGIDGATMTFGAQKLPPPGDDIDLLLRLEQALMRWAQVVERDLQAPIADRPGGGAGGGLAAGLAATTPLSGARIDDGAALIGEIIGLDRLIEEADLVVTSEDALDAQTTLGKSVSYVGARAAALGRPCLVVAGRIEALPPGVTDAEAVLPPDAGAAAHETAMIAAAPAVQAAAHRLLARHLAR